MDLGQYKTHKISKMKHAATSENSNRAVLQRLSGTPRFLD